MVSIWERSETFAHGFVVFPIFLYLLWRQRDDIGAIQRVRFPPALLGIVGAGAVWFIGEKVNATVVSQLAMIAMVPFAVWAVLGTRVAAALCIPLGFLFFAVPFGEFLVPTLTDWTADFTVTAINASGIPIYREGNYFQIPSGRWSVIDACSGFRYLIASFMVGCLYAYLSYRSTKRRVTFIAVSLIVPIFANWLRAYMIVMLGHLSSNRIAVGADHLLYGWVFFGLVMGMLFWFGSRWREDDIPVRASSMKTPALSLPPPQHASYWPMLLAVFALTTIWPLLEASMQHGAQGGKIDLGRVSERNGWVDVSGSLSDWRPDVSGANVELRQTFAKEGRQVGLFIAYFREQNRDSKAIASTNQIVRVGNEFWNQIDAGTAFITIDGQRLNVRTAVVASPRQRLAVWQWFWVNGHETSSAFIAKLYQTLSVLQGRGDPVAWVVVYMPVNSGAADADATLREFSANMHGSINQAIREAVAH
jgi:exosortase A